MMQLPLELSLHGIDLLEVRDQYGNVYEIPVEPDGAFYSMIPAIEGRYVLTFTAYRGKGENQHVYAERIRILTISSYQGERGKIFCD
jgi:hypothetical protein